MVKQLQVYHNLCHIFLDPKDEIQIMFYYLSLFF